MSQTTYCVCPLGKSGWHKSGCPEFSAFREMSPPIERASTGHFAQRCEALETELAALKARVERLEARR